MLWQVSRHCKLSCWSLSGYQGLDRLLLEDTWIRLVKKEKGQGVSEFDFSCSLIISAYWIDYKYFYGKCNGVSQAVFGTTP